MLEKILIVEDDLFFREMFRNLLNEEGYAVDTASSSREALDRLEKDEYQIVITDLVMPGMSGIELLSLVKQRDPDIDVILVTADTNVETAIFALKNGARDYLIKPINHDEFKHAVSLCLEQRRLLNENTELKGLVHLFQVGQTIANCLELERLYGVVVDAVAKETGATRVMGFFLDDESKLSLHEQRGFTEEDSERLAGLLVPMCLKDGLSGQAVLDVGECLQGEDLHADFAAGIGEAVFLFLRSKSLLQGVVILFCGCGGPSRNDINFRNLNFLLDQSSLALENANRYATAKNLLYIDELTGLFNYRYLDMALEREIKRAERYGSSVTVIFIDLDFFKHVNDTHGHLVGSRVLREAGNLLKTSVREVDLVIRYGGDEFTIILVETSVSSAAAVTERIRALVEKHHFLEDEGYDIRLTACLGYASYPEDTRSKQELLDVSDQAMYRGKESGRNRVFRAIAKPGGKGV